MLFKAIWHLNYNKINNQMFGDPMPDNSPSHEKLRKRQTSRSPSYEKGKPKDSRVAQPESRSFTNYGEEEKAPVVDTGNYEVVVKNMPFRITEDGIEDFFRNCGVKHVNILKGPDGRPRGMGFVKLTSLKGMEEALALDGVQMEGRNVRIEQAKGSREGGSSSFGGGSSQGSSQGGNFGPKNPADKPEGCTTIFVGNLSFGIDEAKLEDFFSKCGRVKDVRMKRNDNGRVKSKLHLSIF